MYHPLESSRCIAQSEQHGDPLHEAIRGMKRRLVDVLITHSYLPKARGEVEMGVKVRVLKLIKRVVHTRKRVSIFTRNFIKGTVVNAQSKRTISLAHKKNWRAELTVDGTY
jgi:hypothetical protein